MPALGAGFLDQVNRAFDHAAKFTVRVSVHKVGEVEGTGSSKQDAETEAARLFMERFG